MEIKHIFEDLLGDLTLYDAIALHEASEEQDVADDKERESERRQSAFVLRVIKYLEQK